MQYQTTQTLNLYASDEFDALVTQAAAGSYLVVLDRNDAQSAIPVKLVADGYPGWMNPADWPQLVPQSVSASPAKHWDRTTIADRLADVIAFTQLAMAVPNEYLWGGTVAPNYDCSGLMQAAFRSVGIVIPRDAYQQEAWCKSVAPDQVAVGDLVFFGTPQKATHVGLMVERDRYIHSSGLDQGRNGIGIDHLSASSDPVGARYFSTLRGFGRVVQNYQPI